MDPLPTMHNILICEICCFMSSCVHQSWDIERNENKYLLLFECENLSELPVWI